MIAFATFLSSGSTGAVDTMKGESHSFMCTISDIPVVWNFKSNITGVYHIIAYLDTAGKLYVGPSTSYRLQR